MANFQKIKELCKEKKMKISELAKKIGIKENALHNMIQNGTTKTSTIEKIATELGVPVGTFFDGGAVNINNGIGLVGSSNSGNITLSQQQREVEMLKQQLQDKNEIISLLKQQLKSKK